MAGASELSDAHRRFLELVRDFESQAGVTASAGADAQQNRFGSSALKVNGKIFAMLVQDSLVLKLPAARVRQLADAGHGVLFKPRRDGRLMKEWLVLSPSGGHDWNALAQEALAFVRR